MKSIFKALISSCLFFCVTNSYASGYLTSLSGSGATISTYFTHSSGAVTLILESNTSKNPDSCAVTNRVHLKGDLDGHKNMVAAALTAFASGKTVGFHSSGCEDIPFWGGNILTPVINNLWVFN